MPWAVWWPRRNRLRDLESFRLGTAIDPSVVRAAHRALARPGVQVCPTGGAKSLAILAAERKSRRLQHQLLAHRHGQVDRRRIGGQWVDAGILLQLRVGREQKRDRLVHLLLHVTETPATLACDPGPDVTLPDVVVGFGPAEPPAHFD